MLFSSGMVSARCFSNTTSLIFLALYPAMRLCLARNCLTRHSHGLLFFLYFFLFYCSKFFMFYQAKNYNISKSCLIAIVRNCLLKIGKISPINRCTYTIQNLSLFKIVCFLTISLLLPILVKSFCHARNRLTWQFIGKSLGSPCFLCFFIFFIPYFLFFFFQKKNKSHQSISAILSSASAPFSLVQSPSKFIFNRDYI